MSVRVTAIEAEAYSPFGSVIMAARGDVAPRAANQGTAEKYSGLANFDNLRISDAPVNVSVFRVAPHTDASVDVRLLEKHPESTQIFVPMNAQRYLVIVALGEEAPDLSSLRAFMVRPDQAISYHPGVWHHPMVGLDCSTDFVCLTHEDGSSADCVIHQIPEAQRVVVQFGHTLELAHG